jgi:RND family efflux transporter MFP subunit
LVAIEAVSLQEYDDAIAAADQAKAALNKAKADIDYTKVYSPISGYVGKSNVTEGTLVTANQVGILTTVTQLDPIYVDMAQPTKDMLQLGQQKEIPVSLIMEGTEYQNTGVLKFSEVFADESTDSVRLRAKFSNKDKKLIPGMFVNAKLHLKPIDAITVPQKATNRGPDGSLIVWVVDQNNVAKPRPIKAEKTSDDNWIVSEGLADGEVVILEGFQKLSDGAKVKPIAVQTLFAKEGGIAERR